MIHRLVRQQVVSTNLDVVWNYFATPKNLDEMTPPDMKFKILSGGEEPMYLGQLIEYRVQIMPMVSSRWLTEIAHLEEKTFFVDEQRRGPYKFWYHEHRFEPINGGTKISDRVTYALPFGPLGELVHAIWVNRRLKYIFNFRRDKVQTLFNS